MTFDLSTLELDAHKQGVTWYLDNADYPFDRLHAAHAKHPEGSPTQGIIIGSHGGGGNAETHRGSAQRNVPAKILFSDSLTKSERVAESLAHEMGHLVDAYELTDHDRNVIRIALDDGAPRWADQWTSFQGTGHYEHDVDEAFCEAFAVAFAPLPIPSIPWPTRPVTRARAGFIRAYLSLPERKQFPLWLKPPKRTKRQLIAQTKSTTVPLTDLLDLTNIGRLLAGDPNLATAVNRHRERGHKVALQ